MGLLSVGATEKEEAGCFVLAEEKLLSDGMLVEAREASDDDLLVVHTRRYLNELKVRGLRQGTLAGGQSSSAQECQGCHLCSQSGGT